MILPLQNRRLWMLALLLVLAFAGLGYRLVDLQVLRHEQLLERARANTQRSFFIEAPRGEIRDSRGNPLATSQMVKTVCADPALINNAQVGHRAAEVAHALSPLLQIPESDLLEKLSLRIYTNSLGKIVTNQYVVLKRKVRLDEWDQIRLAIETMPSLPETKSLPRRLRPSYEGLRKRSIFAEDDQLREYPNQRLASHILGYVGYKDTDKGRAPVMIGLDGVELTLNGALTGVRGWRQTELDERRRELVVFREQDVPARPGLNAFLTVDLGVQQIVEAELLTAVEKHRPVSASAIVVRPSTGAILAMATWPDYDPNDPGASPPEHRRNRVICDVAEPGSTFKVVVVSAALNDGVVRLEDRFDCEHGRFSYAGRILRDHDPYDILNVEEIITKSSNIGSAKIAIKIGPERLYRAIREFGFGDRTGIDLGGEVRGLTPPVKQWSKLSLSRIPMGQGIACTSLQMVMAMSAIANQGRLMRPMLVDRFEDAQGRVVQQCKPRMVRQVISETAARQMVQALKTVISTNGTASKARLTYYTVAGKTGTAEKAKVNGRGYDPGKYFSSFIGFFPADAPELCISVVLDEPRQGYYGGQTAAPVFKNIAERTASYLSLRPEFIPETTLAADSLPGRRRLTTR